jgi:pyruvate/2-oxoglutarate dehydrogenase complex dihydrolipoamide acyltransferase (E2) component
MPTQVLMPQLGESVVEGTITRWLKNIGEQVSEFEPLVEVNTDKVDTEVPSPATGTLLEILIPEGTTIHAGTLLAWIGQEGETPVESPSLPQAESLEQPVKAAARGTQMPPSPDTGLDRALGFISPVVARIASEQAVDLFQVKGTGQGGRITKKDILAYIDSRPTQTPIPSAPPRTSGPIPVPTPLPSPSARPQPVPAKAPVPFTPGTVIPFTLVRRQIAEHMVLSKRTSPHVTTVMEADLSRVVAHRQANKDAYARDGVNLTFTAYFIAAAVAALKAFPLVNSSWSDEGIVLHPQINIGMATSLGEEGLIVPVLKDAETLSLLGIARQINDLAERARAHKLQPDEVKGGTFTITNHGISGSLFATPIINQPQCAILGVGVIQKRVVVVNVPDSGDTIAIRPMVYLSLTFDHRILDGASADHCLEKLVQTLQNWM